MDVYFACISYRSWFVPLDTSVTGLKYFHGSSLQYSLLSTLLSCLAFDIRTSEQDTLFNTHRMAY